jgi:hypothetical protein
MHPETPSVTAKIKLTSAFGVISIVFRSFIAFLVAASNATGSLPRAVSIAPSA